MPKVKVTITPALLMNHFATLQTSLETFLNAESTFNAFASANTDLPAEVIKAVKNQLIAGKLASNNDSWKEFHWIFARLVNKITRQSDDQMITSNHLELARMLLDIILPLYGGESIIEEEEEIEEDNLVDRNNEEKLRVKEK